MAFVDFPNAVDCPENPMVKDISVEEVKEKVADVALIDVRRSDEYTGELGHIPGSKLVTLDQLENRIEELPKDQTIVFICRSGKRSITASMLAQQNGLEHTYNMVGGMIRWNEAGFEVEK